jgi:hypothetical protein
VQAGELLAHHLEEERDAFKALFGANYHRLKEIKRIAVLGDDG